MHGRVERTHPEFDAFHRAYPGGEPVGKWHPAGGYPEKHDAVSAGGLLQDLMSHPGEYPADVGTGEDRTDGAMAGCLRTG